MRIRETSVSHTLFLARAHTHIGWGCSLGVCNQKPIFEAVVTLGSHVLALVWSSRVGAGDLLSFGSSYRPLVLEPCAVCEQRCVTVVVLERCRDLRGLGGRGRAGGRMRVPWRGLR